MFSSANKKEFLPFEQLKQFDQKALFQKYAGIYPEEGQTYKSVFRHDRKPNCRFKWLDGFLFFVDNATFNGKLYFTIIDTISILFNITPLEAFHKILQENNKQVGFSSYIKSKTDKSNAVKPSIRFEYSEWEEDNYFMISPDHLDYENVFKVSRYWINKHDGEGWKLNMMYNPQKVLTIAYYFPKTDRVKLYFPNQEYRFYTNTDFEVFGEDYIDEWYNTISDVCIITKSQKDRLLLQYLYGIPAIAPQNEKIIIPQHIIDKIKMFDKQFIFYDNDRTGIECSTKLSELTGIPNIINSSFTEKDVFDLTITHGRENIKKYITSLIN